MMGFYLEKKELVTKDAQKIYDITDNVNSVISRSGFDSGHVLVQTMHTTTGIYCNEGEKFLLEDFIFHLNAQAPNIRGKYLHDNISERRDCPPDEPENGHSHIKSALYSNVSVSLILHERKLQLGRYQRIFFAEFDGPCPRKHKSKRNYLVSIIGE